MKHNQFSTYFFLLTAIFTLQTEISANEKFRPEGYHFKKTLNPADPASIKHSEAPEYGVFPYDDDLIKYGYGKDIRIAQNKKTIPYFIRNTSSPEYEKQKNKTDEIFRKNLRDSSIHVIKLPILPENSCYTSVVVSSSDNYEAGIYIQTSDDSENWSENGYRSIYRYSNKELSLLRLDCIRSKYLRLTVDDSTRLSFPSAYHSKKENETLKTKTIELNEIIIKNNSDLNSTQLYFSNPDKLRIQRIILTFSDSIFKRRFEISMKNPGTKRFEYLTSGSFSATNPGQKQIIDLPRILSEPLKIEIYNDDNEPLKTASLLAVFPSEEILFEIPPSAAENTGLMIYYGNKYSSRPNYDIRETHDKNLGHIQFKTGTHTANEKFAYSLIEPPMSIWMIRILFILGILAVAYPSYRIFKKFQKDMSIHSD